MSERASHGWCSLRLRFDARELELLRGAEQLRGAAMSRTSRPDALRTALSLARAGQKVARAAPGGQIVLDQAELELLVEATRFAARELPGATRPDAGSAERDAVLGAFPELAEKGLWRTFGLTRELDALSGRLAAALSS